MYIRLYKIATHAMFTAGHNHCHNCQNIYILVVLKYNYKPLAWTFTSTLGIYTEEIDTGVILSTSTNKHVAVNAVHIYADIWIWIGIPYLNISPVRDIHLLVTLIYRRRLGTAYL